MSKGSTLIIYVLLNIYLNYHKNYGMIYILPLSIQNEYNLLPVLDNNAAWKI